MHSFPAYAPPPSQSYVEFRGLLFVQTRQQVHKQAKMGENMLKHYELCFALLARYTTYSDVFGMEVPTCEALFLQFVL